MIKLPIYQSTLIYSALYLKRALNPDGIITLTEKEFYDYFNLVINNIEEEKQIANAFDYEIIYEGEPEYKLNLAEPETLNLLKSATYTYSKQSKLITTSANKKALSLKSTHTYPQSIAMTLRPNGYKKALNIASEKEKNDSQPNM